MENKNNDKIIAWTNHNGIEKIIAHNGDILKKLKNGKWVNYKNENMVACDYIANCYYSIHKCKIYEYKDCPFYVLKNDY